MPDFESSPEAALLARLAKLHRGERAPAEFRASVAQRIAVLPSVEPETPLAGRRRASGSKLVWAPLLAAAIALVVWVIAGERDVIPSREVSTRPSSPQPVSFSGSALPGTLRWRQSGVPSRDERTDCEYRFALRPDSTQRELRVLWKECEFPDSLREVTTRRSSSITDIEVRVFVAGSWSASGELQATELRVLAP